MSDKFMKNSLILTISNSTMGILRFVFSIILSRELGAEALGLYSLIMPLYDLFCCASCGGLVTAISRETSILYGKNDLKNLNRTIKICMYIELIWSFLIGLCLFFISNYLSIYVIKDTRTLHSIQVVSPAIIFISLSSVLKGYFYGTMKVNVPAIIDIVEKAIRILVVIFIINFFSLKNVTKSVTAVYIALSLGEFISFVLLYAYYTHYKNSKKGICIKRERYSQLIFNILIVSLPLAINSFLSTALSTISTLIIPRRLMACNIAYKEALSMIGKFTGMALNITLFPLIVIASISIILVPDISMNMEKNDYYALESRVKGVMRISYLLGISTMIICLTIPDQLSYLFYRRNDLGNYIKIASLSAPFIYASATSFSILSGLGRQNKILINSLIISFEELVLLYILTGIPSINIYGYGISLIVTCITSLILNWIEIRKYCSMSSSISTIFNDTMISMLLYFVLIIINNIVPNNFFALKYVFIISFGFSFYFFSISFIDNLFKP